MTKFVYHTAWLVGPVLAIAVALPTRSAYPAGGRPFNMIVIGDSIMWGQGLEEGDKISTGVQQWVRTQLFGLQVKREVFAHSGAVIGPDGGDNRLPKAGE